MNDELDDRQCRELLPKMGGISRTVAVQAVVIGDRYNYYSACNPTNPIIFLNSHDLELSENTYNMIISKLKS